MAQGIFLDILKARTKTKLFQISQIAAILGGIKTVDLVCDAIGEREAKAYRKEEKKEASLL